MTERLCDEAVLALRQIVRGIDLESKKLVQHHGITGPQALLLKHLLSATGLAVGELAKQVNLSQATVTDILDRLEKRELVKRTRSETDKRRVLVSATPTVVKIFQDTPALLETNFTSAFKKLDTQEQAQIAAILKRVATLMGADAFNALPGVANDAATAGFSPGKDVPNNGVIGTA